MWTALIAILQTLCGLYAWVIIAAAIVSYFNVDPASRIVRLLYRVTDPVLEKIRKRIPWRHDARFDISPIVAILILVLLQYLLEFLIR